MDITIVIQGMLSGLLTGGIIALVALGLSLVWGVMGILNMAHTNFLMLALFIGYVLVKVFGIHPYLTLPVLVVLFFGLGMLVMRYLIRPIMGQSHETPLLMTMGILVFTESLVVTVQSQVFHVRFVSVDPKFWMGVFQLGPFAISKAQLVGFGASIALALSLYWLIRRTAIGRAIQACTESTTLALNVGINVKRVQLIAFGIGVACAAAAAPFMLPTYTIDPKIGQTFLVSIFAAVAMGGIGNFIGTLVGGLIIGLAGGLAGAFLPGSLVPAVAFGLLIIVLMFRPEGIFRQ